MSEGFNRWVQHTEAAKGGRQGRDGHRSQQPNQKSRFLPAGPTSKETFNDQNV